MECPFLLPAKDPISSLAFGRLQAPQAALLHTPRLGSSSSKWLGDLEQMRKSTSQRPVQISPARGALGSTSTASNVIAPRIFVGFSIYKGKTAFSMNPGKPVFKATETGDIRLEKEGSLYMQFAPAVAQRKYDWNRKQIIALSVEELGTLMRLLPTESCEFFHDPYIGKSDAGKVRKVLKVEPIPDNSGFFFNFYVVNRINNIDERLHLPVTKAEFTVMRSAFNFIIPYLMGWHAYVNSSQLDQSLISGASEPQGFGIVVNDPDLEWAK